MPPAATQRPVEEEEQHAPRTPARHNLLPADAPESAWKESLFAALRQYVVQCGGRACLSSFCRDTSATLRPKKQRTIVRLIEESGPRCGISVLATGGEVELAVHLPAASAPLAKRPRRSARPSLLPVLLQTRSPRRPRACRLIPRRQRHRLGRRLPETCTSDRGQAKLRYPSLRAPHRHWRLPPRLAPRRR